MASAYSDVAPVITGTSVRNRKTSFYRTQVTTLANGGLKRETYRTDKEGNGVNDVKISETIVSGSPPTKTTTVTANASANERRAIQNKNSSLNNSINQQTKQATDKALESNIDPVTPEVIDKASGGSGNTATEPETGDSQATTTSTPSSTRNFGNDMRYPEDMEGGQDVIQFTALTYAPKTITGFSFGGRDRVKPGGGGGGRSKGTVTLPIQSGIKDMNAAGWGEETMNPLEAMMAKSALDLVKDGDASNIGEAGKQIQENTPAFQKGIGAAVVSSATGVKNILARTEGKVVNPNLELLFQKPTLRPFTFTFKLSARSATEAQKIVRIIRFFKQNMAPQKGGGSGGESANLFLKAPNTFQIHYIHAGGNEHPYIGRPKECAMTSFEVDYTPDGNYSTFIDGFMTSYTISMSLKELEPVFYEDYNEFPDTQIGF